MPDIKPVDRIFFQRNPELTISQMAETRGLPRANVKMFLHRNGIEFKRESAVITADDMAVAEELITQYGLSCAEAAKFLRVSAAYFRVARSAARRYGFDPDTRKIRRAESEC